MSKLPPYIGLWSPAPGCGKSTVAHLISNRLPRYAVLPFAQPLKLMLHPFLVCAGYSTQEVTELLNTSHGKSRVLDRLPGQLTPRHLLRTLGTEWGRQLQHPDVWVAIWMGRAKCFSGVIADDVRFNSEALAVRALGGEVWAVERPGFADTSGHPSEAGIDPLFIDRRIVNDGDLLDLEHRIDTALSQQP